ncbi:MAG: Lipid-A-disaccharide synthase [Candidatus Omnitrophica bacterium ADurb.Bin205]|nr:MAG: Lipid-A-disaccharide synthase [Candidatus Omnitrophica bacterium ADurb.Bin205]
MAEKQVLIICGEPSGELHAAGLVREIKKIDPEIKISGIGSSLLENAGADIFYDIRGLAVMGLFDVFKKLPRFISLKNLILKKIRNERWNAIIFVDFSGFNLRLAKKINNEILTIYYVSPQLWASREGRIKTIKKYIKKVIVLFKFERTFYKKHGVDADWAGHPLLDIVKPTMAKDELINNLKLDRNKTTISLFPGSRKQEVKRIFPIMLKSSILIERKLNAQFIVAKYPQVEWDTYKELIKKYGVDVKIVEGKPYDCMNVAEFCLVCSGTATLETAIMQKPFCLIYKMGFLNFLLYRPQVKLPYIGLANIVAGKKIIPEFIQLKATPGRIADYTVKTLKDPAKIKAIKEDLSAIRPHLGETGAASYAARSIINFLSKS